MSRPPRPPSKPLWFGLIFGSAAVALILALSMHDATFAAIVVGEVVLVALGLAYGHGLFSRRRS